MNQEEIHALLQRTNPALVGVVGSIDRHGFPHTVPVWYDYDGTTVSIWTSPDRQWVKNLRRNLRASFSVFDGAPPFAAVVLKGLAEMTTGGQGLTDRIRRITRRYMPEAEVESYMQEWAHLETIVSITPTRTVGWGRGY